MATIYAECYDNGGGGNFEARTRRQKGCAHAHRKPSRAAMCPDTHQAASPQGMHSTAFIAASDDGGNTWRRLTDEEVEEVEEGEHAFA